MIQLLFPLIFAEMALIGIFVFRTPLRKLVILGLDRVKRGRGSIVVKTVAGTVFVVMLSTIYNVISLRNRWIEDEGGDITPTDQILLAQHLLEASLMGFSLFLGLMIDRLHHYIRELRMRRKTMEAVKKQNRAIDEGKAGISEEIKSLEEQASSLRERIKQLESEVEEKSKEASSSEANAIALKKQSEGFLLEYDRLLEENQHLRSQLQSLDRKLSHSDSKKVS
ncbi:PREDICTED: B-cell receptor-associated protein 31-like [Ipomoea nil]|uniref:B-cell receptor-associated protein 31-like n=1 Tax=Ipomoea nil TaxID=35883 RepID=UPI0009014565|nr:PREDICTED: B-cell receptor-associated protein 31-like [Ipomoea nil]